jgi:hypothetical protein
LVVKGRFGKQDFVYVTADDVYLCPAGEQLFIEKISSTSRRMLPWHSHARREPRSVDLDLASSIRSNRSGRAQIAHQKRHRRSSHTELAFPIAAHLLSARV